MIGEAPDGLRVAVLIPTYDEPSEVIAPTIAAACALEPAHETWVLDDGERPEVEQLAKALGARYLLLSMRGGRWHSLAIQADDDDHFQLFRRQPSHLPGMLTRWEMLQAYAARTGLSVTREQWAFYEVFGLFRLAVIAQQIYYRYHHGQTTNEAYAGFLPVVQYLEQRCTALVDAASGPAA